jgi:hypothetical protein
VVVAISNVGILKEIVEYTVEVIIGVGVCFGILLALYLSGPRLSTFSLLRNGGIML